MATWWVCMEKASARRAAVIGQDAQHRGEFVDIGAAAAKFRRHAGFDQAGRFQQGEIVGDELVLVGRSIGAFAQTAVELARDVGDACGGVCRVNVAVLRSCS